MARIQILPLPTQRVDALEVVPFAIVVDQLDPDVDGLTQADLEQLKHDTGARTIIGYQGTLDVAEPMQLDDEQAAEILAALGLS